MKKKKVTQADKAKIRHSKEWKELREIVADDFDRCDPITLKPLRKGFNCHHMSENPEKYSDFTRTTPDGKYRFLPLNKSQHDLIHVIYRYAVSDPEYLDRLIKYVNMMLEVNNEER